MEFNNLLVPVDFSPISRRLVAQAAAMATGENPVLIVMHVLDPELIEFAANHKFGAHDEIVQRMRERAMAELEQFRSVATGDMEIEIIVCEGTPFLQIIQKAQEFLADAIVMGKVGGQSRMEKLLFGSTAEKVMRASTRPVVVLPLEPEPEPETEKNESGAV